MRSFRSGEYRRTAVAGPLRPFCPSAAAMSLEEVDLGALHAAGKRLILLDVDNTLVLWRSEDIPESTFVWLEAGKNLGLQFCILSNTRRRERLARLAERFGIPFIVGKFKPSRQMYLEALKQYGATAEQAVMVGDQLMTDVWGANRANIDAIWVKPMGTHEFVGTKVNRAFEGVIRRLMSSALEGNPAAEAASGGIAGIFQHRLIRQFIKFCVVGALSTVIDLGVHRILLTYASWNGSQLTSLVGEWINSTFLHMQNPSAREIHDAAFGPLKVPGTVLAVLNSFYWNRRWTFSVLGKESRHHQMVKFFTVAIIGMVLNVIISTGLNAIIPGHPTRSWAIASLVATVAVVFWNFNAQRLWTFRKDMEH